MNEEDRIAARIASLGLALRQTARTVLAVQGACLSETAAAMMWGVSVELSVAANEAAAERDGRKADRDVIEQDARQVMARMHVAFTEYFAVRFGDGGEGDDFAKASGIAREGLDIVKSQKAGQ